MDTESSNCHYSFLSLHGLVGLALFFYLHGAGGWGLHYLYIPLGRHNCIEYGNI